jgi:hypothetical protein
MDDIEEIMNRVKLKSQYRLHSSLMYHQPKSSLHLQSLLWRNYMPNTSCQDSQIDLRKKERSKA